MPSKLVLVTASASADGASVDMIARWSAKSRNGWSADAYERKCVMKLQLWSVDGNGDPDELLDEVDVADDEFDYAQIDGEAATVLLGSLHKGRLTE